LGNLIFLSCAANILFVLRVTENRQVRRRPQKRAANGPAPPARVAGPRGAGAAGRIRVARFFGQGIDWYSNKIGAARAIGRDG
jgi:hypothetical protein